MKEQVITRPRDLQVGGEPYRLVWHKRRWMCRETACALATFTEQVPQIPARARITGRLRERVGRDVTDGGRTVVQAGRDHGLSWPVVHRAFVAYAAKVLPEDPPDTSVLGVDETRRGKAVWRRDEGTGAWVLVADCWHVGFVDAAGHAGLFGQVEGRTAEAVQGWLAAQPAVWRRGIRFAAIDMCATFRAAIRRALPHATIVVDVFHLVQLANRKLAALRRRLTFTQRGRRGRTGDPEWEVRGLLVRNIEDLTSEQINKIERNLGWMGTRGRHIAAAWKTKELLRSLLRLTFKHSRHTPSRTTISGARYRLQAWCAQHPFLPELVSLAETIDQWWDQIEAYVLTGITNAASEGNNRLIKLEARTAFGFRNRENQRLRSRCATTRRARREARPSSAWVRSSRMA
ncbi:ISL3 family transposase [Actinomadura coerulea]|uniref:ISL3 family transposase n=1 Tax=Actinomadura coerulea TaxID=46159 RepID=UPI0034321D9D